MIDDRFKDAGQFQPDRAWSQIVKDDSRRRAAARITWKDSAFAAWMVVLLLICLVGSLIGFGFWLFG